MSETRTPMMIDIVPKDGGRYKTISSLSWTDIPGLAILTGRNGSGKTQLLELLAYHLSGARPPGMRPNSALPVEVRIVGPIYHAEDIAYVPSSGRFSGGSPSSLANLRSFREQALQPAQNVPNNAHDISARVRTNRILKRLADRQPNQFTPEMLEQTMSDADFATDDIDITAGLTHVFMAHRLKSMEALERGTPGKDEEGKSFGPAPWDLVNEALRASGFPYEVISPSKTKLLDDYTLRLEDRQSGIEIPARDLSSGEKVLLQLVLWLYTAGESDKFPKLLLLDEPDAHLHPSMTTQFFDVVSEVLVKRHGVRVIITTHSPSTVALAPEGSVFQLERGASFVTKVDQRADIISVLTTGLITVSKTTKYCFVEDEDDVSFYQAIYDVLMDHGPSRDPMSLQPSPSMAFIPASVGTGPTKVAGGYTIVKKWVEKLDADPLDRTFYGVIDRDVGNTTTDRIWVVGRYSFENYLLDPLNLFCLLLENDAAVSVPGVQVSPGDEHPLRVQPDSILQAIAQVVTSKMEIAEPNLKTTATSIVTYTVGKRITVPSWVIDHRGHDLLRVAQNAFGGPRIVTPPRLVRALRRGRLIPTELASLLTEIQRRP